MGPVRPGVNGDGSLTEADSLVKVPDRHLQECCNLQCPHVAWAQVQGLLNVAPCCIKVELVVEIDHSKLGMRRAISPVCLQGALDGVPPQLEPFIGGMKPEIARLFVVHNGQ